MAKAHRQVALQMAHEKEMKQSPSLGVQPNLGSADCASTNGSNGCCTSFSAQAAPNTAWECVALMHLLAYTHDAAGREKAIFDWRCYRSKKMIVWVSSHIGSSFMDARRQLNG
ncbi:hypothetical protein WJX84_007149 [Apatococcus fuscideae]|uniref:Uncharacterized protein n=1 Tax=Apatococcus fuscideae TaxID=2026836 RepID=A0AAW1RQX1_9CHLO